MTPEMAELLVKILTVAVGFNVLGSFFMYKWIVKLQGIVDDLASQLAKLSDS